MRKLITILLICLLSFKSNGQKIIGWTYDDKGGDTTILYEDGSRKIVSPKITLSSSTLINSKLDIKNKKGYFEHENGFPIRFYADFKSDTIPTILLCADTSRIVPIIISGGSDSIRFEGLSTPLSLFSQLTVFTVIGYRVAGNTLYSITSKHQLIDGLIYLDDKKRPLPASFIVFSFVDRKQP